MYASLTAEQLKKPCLNCKQLGHWARECPEEDHRKEQDNGDDEGEQTDTTEPNKGRPPSNKKGAADNGGRKKKAFNVRAGDTRDDFDDIFGFTVGATPHKQDKPKLDPFLVYIDSLANMSFAANEHLLRNIRGRHLNVNGIHGEAPTSMVGTLPGFGEAIYAPDAGTNGLALCEIEERYRVTYEQRVRFVVHVNASLQLVFDYDAKVGSYACVFNESIINALIEEDSRYPYCMITTISDTEANYSSRELKRAQEARKMMRKTYYASDGALVRTVTKGAMLECPVTGKDVRMATDIYGKDVASLQGKTKDKGPVADDRVFVPAMEQKEQMVYGDMFHWRGVDFILFIVKPLRLLMVQHLPKTDTSTMVDAVNRLCTKVKSRGYSVTEIITDPAKQLAGLKGLVPYNMNTVGSRTHVADAEVEIRTVKERLRASTAGLPYNLTAKLVKWQVYGCVMTYNMLLRVGQTVSSRELFTGVKPNFSRELRAECGRRIWTSPCGTFESREEWTQNENCGGQCPDTGRQ